MVALTSIGSAFPPVVLGGCLRSRSVSCSAQRRPLPMRRPILVNPPELAPQIPGGISSLTAGMVDYAPCSCDVQLGQRVAASGMAVWQKGQSLVVTGAFGGGLSRLMARTIRKITKAMITNSITVLRNKP